MSDLRVRRRKEKIIIPYSEIYNSDGSLKEQPNGEGFFDILAKMGSKVIEYGAKAAPVVGNIVKEYGPPLANAGANAAATIIKAKAAKKARELDRQSQLVANRHPVIEPSTEYQPDTEEYVPSDKTIDDILAEIRRKRASTVVSGNGIIFHDNMIQT